MKSVPFAGTKLVRTLLLSGAISATTTAGAWLTGADPHHAVVGVPGSASWKAAVSFVAPGGAAPDPLTDSPDQVRRFFAGLTPAQQQALVAKDPGTVGNLQGAPYALRYEANQRVAKVRTPGRLLAFDPRSSGYVTEVFGDLASADQIGVLVPGVGWDLDKIMTRTSAAKANPIRGAEALQAEMQRLKPGVRTAIVVWLGYDPPAGIDRVAARSERAIQGVPGLVRFVNDLPAAAKITLIGHSYGSVVAGRAVSGMGGKVSDLVALASPGMDVGSVADLGTKARVWAARTEDDPIGLTPHLRVGGYGHESDPVTPDFGAKVFGTGSAHGHGDYYLPGTESLTNVARIILGLDSQVTLVNRTA